MVAVPALALAALSLPAGVPAARAVSIGPVPGGHISVGAAPAPAETIPAGAVVLKVSPGGAVHREKTAHPGVTTTSRPQGLRRAGGPVTLIPNGPLHLPASPRR
jgi:hypothetical protein